MLDPTFRPIISIIRITPDRSCVEVSLELEGRVVSGFADIHGADAISAAAEATCAAVCKLLPEGYDVALAWANTFKQSEDATEPVAVVNVAVGLTWPDRANVEPLLGAALVHGDTEVATVRATLDGLTRRLGPVLLTG